VASSAGTPVPGAWFSEACARRGLLVDADPSVGLVAWWDPDHSPGAVASSIGRAEPRDHVAARGHDVRGVTAVLDAVDRLRGAGWSPYRPVAVVAPGPATGTDEEVVVRFVRLPAGPDPSPSTELAGHGLFRIEITGRPGPAGSRSGRRGDPMLTYAMTVLAAAKQARLSGVRATLGRVEVEPNLADVVPSRVTGWLDVRAHTVGAVLTLVAAVERLGQERSVRDATGLSVSAEHVTARVPPAAVAEVLRLLAGPAVPFGT